MMGFLRPMYKEGDFVLYRDKYDSWMMKISGSQIKRCSGDVVPHRYYHGISFLVDESQDAPNFKLARGESRGTGCFNIRESLIEKVSRTLV